jgi:hypothetical protein
LGIPKTPFLVFSELLLRNQTESNLAEPPFFSKKVEENQNAFCRKRFRNPRKAFSSAKGTPKSLPLLIQFNVIPVVKRLPLKHI